MPRYFFHIHDDRDAFDREGVELDNAEHARREAVVVAGSILRDEYQPRWDATPWVLHVVDQDERTICKLTLSGSLA
jgi:hypothetical protein